LDNSIYDEELKTMIVYWICLLQEAFDYIGSSRMVYDMKKGKMNFTVDNIEMFIEIGQVGLHSTPADTTNAKLWLHSGANESMQVTGLFYAAAFSCCDELL